MRQSPDTNLFTASEYAAESRHKLAIASEYAAELRQKLSIASEYAAESRHKLVYKNILQFGCQRKTFLIEFLPHFAKTKNIRKYDN